MRATRSLVNFVVTIALTAAAGCAGLQTTQPSTPSRLLEQQAEGRLPGPVPPDALRYELQQSGNARPRPAFHAGAKVGLWATNTNFNYLLGQDASGKKTVTAVDLSQNNCFSPVAVKVDRARNVWVGCELTSLSGTNGAVQEYSGAGELQRTYRPACPRPTSTCQSFSGYGYDSGIDASGDVFASLNLYSIETCDPTCSDNLGTGFEWWPKGNPSAAPRLIPLGTSCSPVCGVGFMDLDAAGNIWFTFSGYDRSNNYGFGLGEVAGPTKHPKFTVVEPIGTYGFFGGVYASNGGKTLNVIDQKSRTTAQYHLPVSPSGAPFNVLGPTRLNAFGIGDPVSGGFNKADTKMAAGDTGDWLDVGKVAKNSWTAVANPNFYSGIEGAAYTPSDK